MVDSVSRLRVTAGEVLVPLPRAARMLGRHPDTLENWHRDGLMPMFSGPGTRSTYQSWLEAVLASPLPGRAGNLIEVSRKWWADRGVKMEVAA